MNNPFHRDMHVPTAVVGWDRGKCSMSQRGFCRHLRQPWMDTLATLVQRNFCHIKYSNPKIEKWGNLDIRSKYHLQHPGRTCYFLFKGCCIYIYMLCEPNQLKQNIVWKVYKIDHEMDVQSLLASGNFQRGKASHLPFIDSFLLKL